MTAIGASLRLIISFATPSLTDSLGCGLQINKGGRKEGAQNQKGGTAPHYDTLARALVNLITHLCFGPSLSDSGFLQEYEICYLMNLPYRM